MKLRSKLPLFAAALVLGILPKAALADSVTLVLTNPSESISATGGTLGYFATVSAPLSNTMTENLVGDSFNLTAPGLTVDDSPFQNGFPFTLDPGQSFTGLLFNVDVTAGAALGTYLGTFTLQGGTGTNDATLQTVNFSTSVTPEPSSWLLMGTGVLGLGLMMRRRSQLDTPLGMHVSGL